MAVLTVLETSLDGLEITTENAASGGDAFPNDGRTLLYVEAASGDVQVTIDARRPCNQGADHDGGGTVPSGEARLFGPFRPERFNDDLGRVNVAYSAVEGVSVAAIRLPASL